MRWVLYVCFCCFAVTHPTKAAERAREVTVTQADRDAAAVNVLRRLIAQHGGHEQPWMDASTAAMRMGEQDNHSEVQAFARHRLAFAPAPATDSAGVPDGLVERLRAAIHNDAIMFDEMEQRMRECWVGTGKLSDEGSASNDFRVWMNEAHNRQRDLKAVLGQSPFAPLAALSARPSPPKVDATIPEPIDWSKPIEAVHKQTGDRQPVRLSINNQPLSDGAYYIGWPFSLVREPAAV